MSSVKKKDLTELAASVAGFLRAKKSSARLPWRGSKAHVIDLRHVKEP
jgi:hypothetical protein